MRSELSAPTKEEGEFLCLARAMGQAGFPVTGAELRGRALRLQSRGHIELYVADAGDERARITSSGWAQIANMEPA